MRIFFSTTFITLALLVGAVGSAPAAHAQQTPHDICSGRFSSTDGGKTYPSGYYDCLTSEAGFGSVSADSPDPATAGAKTDYEATDTDKPYNIVMQKILELFAWLVGVAALLLDYAVYFTVVKMGSYVNSLSAIGVTWRVLRDIGNIMLIFGFLAAGIATILNTEFYGWKTKMLPMLLVAAVFINFSLFISEAIVDTGNLFATQFYTQINGGDPAGLKKFDPSSISVSNEGISNKIMNQLGLQTIYGDGKFKSEVFKGANPWLIGFMGVILFVVTAFVLFSLAFILIARFVALVFLLIVAPIGFAGLAIPGFAARAKQWWVALMEQTITAPILLLMLYIALRVITDDLFLSGFTQNPQSGAFAWTGFVGNTNLPGFAGILLSFLVAIGLLLAVIVYAKRWSAFGGDWASRMGSKLSFGATAWAGQRTIGRATTAAAARFKSSTYARSNVGRLLSGGLEKVAGSSFDLRGTGVLKTIPFGSSIDAGKAQEGGYAKIRKDATEARTKYAKTLELTPKEEERAKQLEEDQKTLDKNIKETNDEISEINAELKQAQKEGRDTTQLKARKRSMESLKEVQEKRKEGLGTKVALAKNAAQVEYGEKMQKWGAIGSPESALGKVLSVPYWLMVGPAANKDAAKKILKEAKKSKSDKDLDALKKILEDNEKKDSIGTGKKDEESKDEKSGEKGKAEGK